MSSRDISLGVVEGHISEHVPGGHMSEHVLQGCITGGGKRPYVSMSLEDTWVGVSLEGT